MKNLFQGWRPWPWPSLLILAFVSAWTATQSVSADDTATEPLRDGVALRMGGRQVELRLATPHAFRLHLFPVSGAAAATKSIFLSGEVFPTPSFSVTHAGSVVGIKADGGELQVDTGSQKWRLLGATGSPLADWAALPSLGAANPKGTITLGAGGSSAQPHPLYYGSGSAPKLGALTQVESPSRPNNGSTSLPQYWSTAGYGAFMVTADDNHPASWRANGAGVDWTVPGPSADLYLMPAATLYDWVRDDAELTGFAPVPPKWALGYMQSRWGWKDKGYIDDTFAHFRKDNLPVDAFIIDFEWYTKTPDYDVKPEGDPKFDDFGWNPSLFPDPAGQIAALGRQGLHLIGIRKPRLGNSNNLALARSKGWILPPNPEDPNSAEIRLRNLDFSRPEVQAWWQENNRKFVEAGMPGFWNDEGETTYTEYSYWNAMERELFRQVDPNARFWSINRAFAPGVQRFGAAAWTGDTNSDWATLQSTPGQLLSYGLSGMPYGGCDIGGFGGNPTPDLLARWMEAGTFFPVDRSHSSIDATPRFPWNFGPEAEDAIRRALDLRYRLIPYYYSLAFQTERTGAPMMRPLVMEFPADAKVAGTTDEWLMGAGLLAAPVLNPDNKRDVYLPADTWYPLGTGNAVTGPQTLPVQSKLDEIPVYVRAGTILPLGPVVPFTGQPTTDPLEVQVYPGKDGAFDFIEDDGVTLDYRKGLLSNTTFKWDDASRTLSWTLTGSYRGGNRFQTMKAVCFGPAGRVTKQAPLDQAGSIRF